MPLPATTTAIPLTTISQPQTSNNATLFGVNSNTPSFPSTRPTAPSSQQIAAINPPNDASTATNPSTAPIVPATNISQSQGVPRHLNRTLNWSEHLAKTLSFANGLGTMALIAAFVFGIGAWVGMKVQISQGGKSMELAIWTACAEHQAIQNSSLCQSIMAKDFSSEFTKRDNAPLRQELTTVMKRDYMSDDTAKEASNLTPESHSAAKASSPYSNFLSSISPLDRSLIDARSTVDYLYTDPEADPTIRATIFPFVQLLTTPLHWLFDFIESILLLLIYSLHKLLSWMSTVVLVLLQAFLYSWVESFVKGVLAAFDAAIATLMPAWMPYLLVGNLASLLGLSALRSAWYGVNYLESLKWIFVFRVGMWLLVEAFKGGYSLAQHWNSAVAQERRRAAGGSGLDGVEKDQYGALSDQLGFASTRGEGKVKRHPWMAGSEYVSY